MIAKELTLTDDTDETTIEFSICPYFDQLEIEVNDGRTSLTMLNKAQTEELITFLTSNLECLS